MNEKFESWYRNEYSRVLSVVLVATGGDLRTAEDATAESFVKAFERWDEVSAMEQPGAWVSRVAINDAKSIRRRSRRWVPFTPEHHHQSHVDLVPVHSETWKHLDTLTGRQRRALVLRYIEDLSQKGVAASLGVSEGTASATLSQARRKVRSSILNAQEQEHD